MTLPAMAREIERVRPEMGRTLSICAQRAEQNYPDIPLEIVEAAIRDAMVLALGRNNVMRTSDGWTVVHDRKATMHTDNGDPTRSLFAAFMAACKEER